MLLHQRTIFQLVDSRTIGGIESHILNLTRWLMSHGYRTEIVFLRGYGNPHPLQERLASAHIKSHTLNGTAALIQLLTKHDCLLATHGYKAGLIGRLVGKLCRTPVVSTYHNGDVGSGKLRFYTWLDALTSVLASGTICVSPEIKHRLPAQSLLLPNFVKGNHIPTPPGQQVAFVGRLSEEKGPDQFALMTRQFAKEADLQVYGDGPLRKELEMSEPHLHFNGNVTMEMHWHKIGLLCITSRCEGLPLVALEAMARGIPVVSFSLGALPQLIAHGQNGWLIDPDDNASFKQAIHTWLTLSEQQRHAMGVAARARINREYSSDVVCPRIVDLYYQSLHPQSNFRISPDKGHL